MSRRPPIAVGTRVTYLFSTLEDLMLGVAPLDFNARIHALYDAEGEPVSRVPHEARGVSADLRLSDGSILKNVPKQDYLNQEGARWCRPYVRRASYWSSA